MENTNTIETTNVDASATIISEAKKQLKAKAAKVAKKAPKVTQTSIIVRELNRRSVKGAIKASEFPAILAAVKKLLPKAGATNGFIADISKNLMNPPILVLREKAARAPKGKRAAKAAKVTVAGAKRAAKKAKASVADVVAATQADPLATAGDTAH